VGVITKRAQGGEGSSEGKRENISPYIILKYNKSIF
jgi:hypothetical protein